MSSAEAGNVLSYQRGGQVDLGQELALLHRKLDVLSGQVQHLYDRTRALEELKDELVPVTRQALGAIGEELQAVELEFNSAELLHLLRKLLRNTPALIRLLDRLESLDGFASEFEPLGKEVVRNIIERLQQFEERGYFRLLQGALMLFDRVAQHATEEDIERLADNIVPMINTFKRMTQPELLAQTNAALSALQPPQQAASPRVGVWGLLRNLRDPEIQEGVGLLLEAMRQVSRRRAGSGSLASKPTTTANEE
jgi:uncharacterized protein YjgD (DUF1641 family)